MNHADYTSLRYRLLYILYGVAAGALLYYIFHAPLYFAVFAGLAAWMAYVCISSISDTLDEHTRIILEKLGPTGSEEDEPGSDY